ncbi:putative response to drug [Lyophyllum shimeji]|uniref:Response to drug n=1 Tax=Lyophyllum shimeji TaxID=47721 RepID=A0A9P3UKW0_LYOSH|nr:putative response to drug [Lyophyllum shimeji]
MDPSTPSRRSRVPAIDASVAEDFTFAVHSPSSPAHNDIPALRVSIPSNSETPSTSPTTPRTRPSQKFKTSDRARTESRKLLAHVLDQLERRNLPPSIFDAFDRTDDQVTENNLGALLETVKDAVKLKKQKQDSKSQTQAGTADDDSDDDGERGYSTDVTYDLMMQLKDLLIMSVAQGWHIFDDSLSVQHNNDYETSGKPGVSPFSRTRNSLQPGGRRTRSRSPSHSDGGRTNAPQLLSSCISILASIVLEDCRYQVTSPRPSRPPNALQALVLDVAQFLLHINRHDPHVTTKIGFAIIPAFSTFGPEMQARLLTFFENVVMRGVLEDLEQIQGLNEGATGIERPLDSTGSSIAIHVDTVQETAAQDGTEWASWSSRPDTTLKLRSTYAPFQSLSLYSLSSLVAPLLATILECVDLEPRKDTRTHVLHRFCRLLQLIVEKKVDAYSDILQIVAYHSSSARRAALSVLCAFWPAAVGHIVISRPFSETYASEGHQSPMQLVEHRPHHFVPWRFPSDPEGPGLAGFSQPDCRSCSHPIRGFGLLCALCTCGVHFDCYDQPEGSNLLQYSLVSEPNVQRVAMYRFSGIPIEPYNAGRMLTRRGNHIFRPVNLFTLCLCIVCRKPLWGCTNQGLNCSVCKHFVHSACLSNTPNAEFPPCSSSTLNADHVNIDWKDLRSSCVDFYSEILQLSHEALAMRSYEEISIFHAVMWTQLQIVTSGIALGSVVVMRNGSNAAHAKQHKVDEFELHHVVRWCEDLLSSDSLPCSNAMDDYMEENHLARSQHFMMFDWSILMYVCSALKSPYTDLPHASSSDLLSVVQSSQLLTSDPEGSTQPFEAVSLAHMRDALGYGFNVRSDVAARYLLSHLHHLGLFNRMDHNPVLFDGDDVVPIHCAFPLPIALDLSPNVETLVSAVEACLSDIDLSVNEVGFLLLVRRLWPNGMASEYALRRLTRSVLSWILAEDDHLVIILRDYLAKQKALPGVRSAQDPALWPSSQGTRPTPSSSVNNGGDYLATRRALLSRYTRPWLLALHDLDTSAYAVLLYEACLEVEEAFVDSAKDDGTPGVANKDHLLAQCDSVLRCITRLTHHSLAFNVFDDLFRHWLEHVTTQQLFEQSMPSLLRLFPREGDATAPYSAGIDQFDLPTVVSSVEPWRVVTRIAAESTEGRRRSLQWLCLFSRSGVEVPSAIFNTFCSLGSKDNMSLSDVLLLAKSMMWSTWLKPKGRQEMQKLLSELHASLSPQIVRSIKHGGPAEDSVWFIRISFATCLLVYGCDRGKLTELEMIKGADVSGLPSRRKLNTRGSAIEDPLVIDPRLMEAINHYMAVNIEDISCLVAKFLYLFITDCPYLEPYEVDNFILRNGKLLATCAWHVYDIQSPDISGLRAQFLLRTLVVDSEPFREVLETWFLPTSSWERRLLAVTRLFRVILDVTSPSFNVEDRQWQTSVVDIFYYFFTSLWSDEREEIRLAVETFSASLLPAHFDAISACWNESLSKTPVAERIKLISFLIHLHPHFPQWKVLSWDAVTEGLLEDGISEDDPAAARMSLYGLPSDSIDPDLGTLRTSLLYLSLQMIADGIAVDSFVLLKLKHHLVQVTGFCDVSVVPSQNGQSFHVQFGEVSEIPDIALPCVNQLLPVMDSSHAVDIAPSAMAGVNELDGKPVLMLVGSIFVDVFLAMFCTLRELSFLPILTFKNMLETLCVIIYKHDFESRTLRHLQQTLRRAVVRALDCLAADVSYDLRQLALSVVQAFVKRWHTFMGSTIYTAVESVAKLVASQHQHGQDALVAQAKAFLDTTLTKYSQNGLFTNLLKRPLDREFFIVLKQLTDSNAKSTPTASQTLCELLLRDIFGRPFDADPKTFQNVLNNMQAYVEVVFHQNYSMELMQFVGQQLIYFARRASEWPPESINPGPILIICAILIHHNKSRSRDMLSYLDTVMRVLLTRSNVNTDSLSRLLQVTNVPHRKTQLNESVPVANTILLLLLEVLGDGLRLKARVLPSTLKAMIEAITTTEIPGSVSPVIGHLSSLLALVDPGIHFLQSHNWQDVDNDFSASLSVARMLLQVAEQDPTVMRKLSDYGAEKAAHTNLKVRNWNILVAAALMEPKESWYIGLFAQLHAFSYAHHAAMRGYAQGNSAAESSMVDINHAYIAIKLWMLLAYKVSGSSSIVSDSQTFGVWNLLWPPFEGLITQFEVDSRGSQYLTLGTLVLSSVSDLFIFMRTLHIPTALHTSTHITTLDRLRNLAPGETVNQKITRALRYMSEPPPETSFEILVNQAVKDIIAAEKLRVLEARVAQDRRAPERYRRDMRGTT